MKIKISEVIDEFLYRYADEGGNFDDPFLKIVHDLLNVDGVNISQEYVDKTQNNRHELTDEEIKQLQRECITDAYAQAHFHGDKYINSQQAILNFARAILRKAQEK